MVKHIILWKLKEELSDSQKIEAKQNIKEKLEALVGQIDGLKSMHIITEGLDSSSADIMMDSELTDVAALAAYQVNPLHQAVANNTVRPNVEIRLSMDYEV